ncbi:MAG: M14 family zinc carboxypeptidase [Planctomycetota bacterium]|nr:M14 family zinc carboxypeptidase [Planctomycetota bacterium]
MRVALTEWCCVILAVVLVGPLEADQQVVLQTQQIWRFESDTVQITNAFPGGRLNDCQRVAPFEYRLLIRPENQPVNNSAWYAFRIDARAAVTLTVHLAYEGGRHRYYPHLSPDGRAWKLIAKERYAHHREQESATLTLAVAAQQALWVAGGEMIGVAELDAWCQRLAERSFVQRSQAGQSIGGRPLELLTIGNRGAGNLVFLISRQHPPEVTGTMALKAFVGRLCADQPLAKQFRAKFATVVAPMVNPDGVTQGHWRHNNNGVDLNRDWRLFAQPETRQVRDALLKCLARPGARPFLFLDFHSTHRNLFYTQADRHETFPSNFTRRWLAGLRQQFPDYQFRRQGSHNPRGGTSKSWAYEQFGIPAITYEVGDRTRPALVERFAQGAAQEAMKLLLDSLADGTDGSAGDARRGEGATP